ncbi:hypothetical protein IAT38_004987 [Cryptococcus sp. DSM 104549]
MPDKTVIFGVLSFLLVLSPGTALAGATADTKPSIPSQIRGLNPALYDRYEASASGTFTCLDGSLTIPFSAINDDYCDCPDGSDEPGTSACKGGLFWCKNEGHVPGQVRASRVNDGLCEPECCDGSDEWATGACPNNCAEIGKEYRASKEAEDKIRRTGAKVRGTYVKWAVGEKKRLEDELVQKRSEVASVEAEVQKAKTILEKTEARSQQDLDKKKQSPLYLSLLTHRLSLTRLRSKTARLETELDALHDILRELAKGYNPNYQDMAVKAAVVGYEEITGARAVEGDSEGDVKKEVAEDEEEITDKELDELEKKDLEGLLLSDIGEGSTDDEDDDDSTSLLWKLDEYIPESLYDSWESLRDLAIDWIVRLGLAGKPKSKGTTADGPQVAAAREKHRTLNNDLTKLHNAIRSNEDQLAKMEIHYGRDAEWKKLEGTCVEKSHGDYTYELCFFGKATQKSNKDGSNNNLGSFSHWKEDADQGSLSYYSQQVYKNGAKCWNGPNRSATVDISCGTSNQLLSISEPEKCEYRFKVTSPAVCWPDRESSNVVEEETVTSVKEEL